MSEEIFSTTKNGTALLSCRNHNFLVLGTVDKSESMLGYFTKFGDAGADILPIGELYRVM
ncbi:MAG: hypothetical protein WCE95_10010 [Nitrososphaeraceae archaeon]